VGQFDFGTITAVVLHVRYTAREGGDLLKAVVSNLQDMITKGQNRWIGVAVLYPP
jgi:hypothetical protein